MSEIGIIKEVDPQENLLTIEFEARGACKECGICLLGTDKSISLMQLQTKNTLQAKPGDKVEFTLKEGETAKAALLLYAFPLGMLLIGFVLGQRTAEAIDRSKDLLGILFGGLFFCAAFYLISRQEKTRKKQQRDHVQLLRIL